MAETVSISLSDEIKSAIDDASRKEGISVDEVINQALKQYLFLRQFRLLRERMIAKAQAQGIMTDEDVFNEVS